RSITTKVSTISITCSFLIGLNMLVQSAIHFALDYVIQSACRYFEVSISSNKVWGIFDFD
ncbi:hypothetical protein ACT3QV_001806, partial [Vibrio alginolyticus]